MRFLTYEGLAIGALGPQLDRARAAFERDDLAALDLKKLQGGYYRIKLTDSARLILQFVRWQGARAALALEMLPTHAYDKSRFLRGAAIDEARIEPAAEPFEALPIKYLHPSRATFALLDKPLSFDDAQDEVLRRRPPLVIVGSAGSGKTALLLQHLRAAQGRVAYLTESSWLAQTARSLYVALDYAPVDQEADFLSFRQFVDSLEVPPGHAVTFRDFAGFFERHRQKVRFTDAHRCFEELRGVITANAEGVLSRDAYLALGVRQSLFDAEQRSALYELFERYRAWLAETNRFEPNLIAHAWVGKATPRYDFLAIDEVQDLTPAQLGLALRTLTKPGAFVLSGDANQVVHPNFFSWATVKSMFWRGLGTPTAGSSHEASVLKVSYRNAPEVTRTANAVLVLKHLKFGSIDRESNSLLEPVPGEPGEVRGVSLGSPQVRALDEKTRRSTEVAVVVLRDEDKAEARKHFSTPLLFSVLESKGLEYDNVILFRLVASERRVFSELADGVNAAELHVAELEYGRGKDKRDKSAEAYKFFVNALYVGLTRAVKNVWLVEDEPEHPLLTLLKVPFDGQAMAGGVKQATAEDWQREASRLEAQGKLEQVDAIRSQVLRAQPTPWAPLDEARFKELHARALDPKSVSRKARESLLDVLVLHPDKFATSELDRLGFRSLADQAQSETAAAQRLLADYSSKKTRVVLDATEKYGVDHRTMQGLTPLMAAAHAGNAALAQALVDRGASRTARDFYGLQPLHHALRRAWRSESFAKNELNAVWDVVAHASFDVQVDGHLLQVGREQGEYLVFHLMLERLWMSDFNRDLNVMGVATGDLRAYVDRLPESVMRDYRKERPYLSSMLSKNEAQSPTRGTKRLFERRMHGHYSFNPILSLWVEEGAGGSWVGIEQLLGLETRRGAARFVAQRYG